MNRYCNDIEVVLGKSSCHIVTDTIFSKWRIVDLVTVLMLLGIDKTNVHIMLLELLY